MKKIITLITVCFLTLNLFAQQYGNSGAMLKIRDAEGRRILISMDGRKFPQNGRVLTINNVPPGVHRIKIYKMKGFQNSGQGALIYNGSLRVKNGFVYRCTVDDYEGLDIHEFCCLSNNGNFSFDNNNNNGSFDFNDHDWDDNFWGNLDNGWHANDNGNWGNNGNGNGNNNGNNGNWGNGNNNNGNNGNNGNWGNNGNSGNGGNWGNGNNNGNFNNGNDWGTPNQCMGNNSFTAFKATVANNNFDSGKMNIIKAQLSKAYISTAQLKDLVDLFQFESGKLEMAKYGAPRVVDRNNLFLIHNCFTFESSKTEFANFVEALN